jgi:hypothetical protein
MSHREVEENCIENYAGRILNASWISKTLVKNIACTGSNAAHIHQITNDSHDLAAIAPLAPE